MIGYECNITRSNHAQYPLLEIKNMNTAIEGTATIFKNPTFAGVKLLASTQSSQFMNRHRALLFCRRRRRFLVGLPFRQRQSERRLTQLMGDVEQSTQLDVRCVGQLIQKLLLLSRQHLSSLGDLSTHRSTESQAAETCIQVTTTRQMKKQALQVYSYILTY